MNDPFLENGLPNDTEAEKYVLGACLLDAKNLDLISNEPEDFYLDQHKKIYRAMQELRREGRPIQPLSQCGRLKDNFEFGQAGGAGTVGVHAAAERSRMIALT